MKILDGENVSSIIRCGTMGIKTLWIKKAKSLYIESLISPFMVGALDLGNMLKRIEYSWRMFFI